MGKIAKSKDCSTDLEWARTEHLHASLHARSLDWDGSPKGFCTVTRITLAENWKPGLPYWSIDHVAVDADIVRAELERRRIRDRHIAIDLLRKTHTRLLLRVWLKIARITGYFCTDTDYPGTSLSLEDIKTELATRPHIFNKKEGQANRRMLATKGRRNKLKTYA